MMSFAVFFFLILNFGWILSNVEIRSDFEYWVIRSDYKRMLKAFLSFTYKLEIVYFTRFLFDANFNKI